MRGIFAVLVISVAALALAPAVPAKSAPPESKQMTGEEAAGAVFTEVEKRLIRDYFAAHPGSDEAAGKGKGKSKKMPPGLAKRQHLPPGLERHIEKNGTLPPGLAKRDLPPDLVARLPAAHPGTIRQIVGSDVVLIQEATGIVLDVLEGALKKK